GPANPKRYRITGQAEDLRCVAGQARRAFVSVGVNDAQGCSGGAAGNAQAPSCAFIYVKFRGGAGLRDRQIDSAIVIEIGERGAPLFAKNIYTGDGRVHGFKSAVAFASQPEAASVIVAIYIRNGGEEILGQK